MTTDIGADQIVLPPAVAPGGGGEPAENSEEERKRRRRILLLLLLVGLLGVLLSIALWYFFFRKPLPLPQIVEVPMPAYQTSIYGPESAMGIAVTPDGSHIWVADTEGDRVVREYDLAGNLVTTIAPPASTGTEHVPVWVALNPVTQELYVTDRPTGQVYVFDQEGAYLRTFSPTTAIPGWQPVGITFDSAGNLYVTDLGGPTPTVEMLDPSGTVLRTFGDRDALSFPNGVAVDKKGNVYVADSNNGRLLVYAPDGTLASTVGRGVGTGKLGLPRGVSIDEEGRVLVCDPTAQGVHAYRVLGNPGTDLEYLGFFGSQGIGDAQLSFPNGVANDARGRVFITDTGNGRIQVWSY